MTTQIVSMAEVEFTNARKRLQEIISDIKSKGEEAAKILAGMSHPQIQIIKSDFKGIWSSDQIERLAMYGRGEIPSWLAFRQKSLTASTLRRIPESTRKALKDPSTEVELLTQKGVKIRPIGSLSPVELTQVIDTKKGILVAEQQVRRAFSVSAGRRTENDFEDVSSITLSDDGKHLLVVASHVSVRIPIKTLRKFMK